MSFAQKKLTRSNTLRSLQSNSTVKQINCSECHEPAKYKFPNGKAYCMPCSSNICCEACKLE